MKKKKTKEKLEFTQEWGGAESRVFVPFFFHLGRRINPLLSILKAGTRLFGLIGTSVCRISSRQCGNKAAASQLSPLADNSLRQWLTYQCSALHARLGRCSLLSGGGPGGLSGFSCAVCSWLLRHLASNIISKGCCFSVSTGSAKPTHLCHFKETLQTSSLTVCTVVFFLSVNLISKCNQQINIVDRIRQSHDDILWKRYNL